MALRTIAGWRWIIILALISALTIGITAVVWSEEEIPSASPLSLEFVEFMEDYYSNRLQSFDAEDAEYTGYIPPPLQLPEPDLSMELLTQGERLQSFPSYYDLRNEGRLTSIKNQGNCGSCWAFAAYASLESYLMTTATWDFSENHMKNTHGFDWGCCDGGNHHIATAYLAKWGGAVKEADDPYNPNSCYSPPSVTPSKHAQQVYYIRNRTDSLDNDHIKEAVMTYGALYTTMHWSGSYYRSATKSFYYDGTASINHAVNIVGWDDSFSRNNFSTTPPGDGAFIVRNSWGSSWGEGGYFYISYYDSKVGGSNAAYMNAEPVANYDHIYQYDPLGWTSSVGYSSNTAWGANIFTSSSNQVLKAVSFFIAAVNSSYEIQIYLDPTNSPVNQSGLVLTQTGSLAERGYHTIPLDLDILLETGQKFSVVIKFMTPGYNFPIPMERPISGYSSGATANPGESYISSNGNTWSDITNHYNNANVCIKAFTVDPSGMEVSPEENFLSTGYEGGPFDPSSKIYAITNSSASTISWAVSKTQPWLDISPTSGNLSPGQHADVTISINSNADNLGFGEYSDLITFTNSTTGEGNTSRSVMLSVQFLDPGISIAQAKSLPKDSDVFVRNVTVTGTFPNLFYIESDDKSASIACYRVGHDLSIGRRVDVTGRTSINSAGEKYIVVHELDELNNFEFKPTFIVNRSIGGSDWQYDSETGTGQQGTQDSIGLNNIGKLIVTSGRVTHVGSNFFYIDDGSIMPEMYDGSGFEGVRVLASGLTLPSSGDYVKVTGNSSTVRINTLVRPMIRAPIQEYIVILDD